MGNFFNPPPPFIGGAQPHAPHALSPSAEAVPVNNPPFSNLGRAAVIATIVALCQPPDPSPFIGGRQPLEGRHTAAQLLAAPSATQPPFARNWLSSVLAAWVPADLASTRPKQNSPAIPGMSVDSPAFGPGGVFDAVYPKDSIYAGQTYQFALPRRPLPGTPTPPIIAGPTNNPPFGMPVKATLAAISVAWTPPDPLPTLGAKLVFPGPYVPSNPPFGLTDLIAGLNYGGQFFPPAPPLPVLSPRLTPPPSVDNPPFGLLVTIAEPFFTDYSPYQPTPRALLLQGGVQPPVAQPYARAWLASVIAAWTPPDPAPVLPRQNSPAIPGSSVDNPPFGQPDLAQGLARGGSWAASDLPPTLPGVKLVQPGQAAAVFNPAPSFAWLYSVLAAWQGVDPLPTLPGKLSAGIPGQSVDTAPFSRAAHASAIGAWSAVDPLPTLLARLPVQVLAPRVDNPPLRSIATMASVLGVWWTPPDRWTPTPGRFLTLPPAWLPLPGAQAVSYPAPVAVVAYFVPVATVSYPRSS